MDEIYRQDTADEIEKLQTDYYNTILKYRQDIVDKIDKSQTDYDKAIVSLSISALGLTFVIIENLGGASPSHIWAIVAAWSFWSASITSVVISYFLSGKALRKTVDQVDEVLTKIGDQLDQGGGLSGAVGGLASKATQFFNLMSGMLFIGGIVFLIIFTANNLGGVKL